MLDFIEKFTITGFEPGDFTHGTIHRASIALMIVTIIVLSFLLRKKDSKYVHNKMKILAYFTLIVYFTRRGIRVYQGMDVFRAFWPFYLCNVNTIFLSIYIILDLKKGKDFFIITGLAGAALMFVVPVGVFNDRYLTLGILDSLLSHFEIIVIPLVLMFTKAYKLDVKRSGGVILGMLLVTFNVEIMQPILVNESIDYLFLDGTLPFTIDGVNQFFVMFGCALIFVYTIYFLDYLYITENVFNQKVRKKRA